MLHRGNGAASAELPRTRLTNGGLRTGTRPRFRRACRSGSRCSRPGSSSTATRAAWPGRPRRIHSASELRAGSRRSSRAGPSGCCASRRWPRRRRARGRAGPSARGTALVRCAARRSGAPTSRSGASGSRAVGRRARRSSRVAGACLLAARRRPWSPPSRARSPGWWESLPVAPARSRPAGRTDWVDLRRVFGCSCDSDRRAAGRLERNRGSRGASASKCPSTTRVALARSCGRDAHALPARSPRSEAFSRSPRLATAPRTG